jgi:hypothetical protein
MTIRFAKLLCNRLLANRMGSIRQRPPRLLVDDSKIRNATGDHGRRYVDSYWKKPKKMKLEHVVIRNFKGIRHVEFPTEDAPERPPPPERC